MAIETIPITAINNDYGLDDAPLEVLRGYGHALLTIAGADGEVSAAELDWLISHQRRLGAPDEFLAAYQDFDFRHGDLFAILSSISAHISNRKAAAHLIYLAIHMAWADGDYAEAERTRVQRAAQILMVPEDTVATIHCLVDMERAVSRLRSALFQSLPR